MTCRCCIHFDVCSKGGKTQYYGRVIACNDVEERCNLFKNKADVVEVRHGEWIPNQYFKGHYYCSECTRHIEERSGNPSINFPYCHCGAKMDGKGD